MNDKFKILVCVVVTAISIFFLVKGCMHINPSYQGLKFRTEVKLREWNPIPPCPSNQLRV